MRKLLRFSDTSINAHRCFDYNISVINKLTLLLARS